MTTRPFGDFLPHKTSYRHRRTYPQPPAFCSWPASPSRDASIRPHRCQVFLSSCHCFRYTISAARSTTPIRLPTAAGIEPFRPLSLHRPFGPLGSEKPVLAVLCRVDISGNPHRHNRRAHSVPVGYAGPRHNPPPGARLRLSCTIRQPSLPFLCAICCLFADPAVSYGALFGHERKLRGGTCE